MPGHVLVAPDSFKGSLSAAEAADFITAGLLEFSPDCDVRVAPVADGGEGLLDVLGANGFSRREAVVSGPTGRPVQATWGVRGEMAVIEMAQASGLLLADGGAAPLRASSHGTGELIRAALDAGCSEIVLGLGGSACTDGGAGMLESLGARVLGVDGRSVPPGGAGLGQVRRVHREEMDSRLRRVRITLASDVDNPLLGPNGAAVVYAPQKGASTEQVAVLEAGLQNWARRLDPAPSAVDRPGAGAAGGVGFAALVALGATMRRGVDLVLELTGFIEHLRGARLVITGEGSLDQQSLRGKAPVGVASAARAAGVPVIAVVGRSLLSPGELATAGLSAAYALTELQPDRQVCIAQAGPLLQRLCATRVGPDWL